MALAQASQRVVRSTSGQVEHTVGAADEGQRAGQGPDVHPAGNPSVDVVPLDGGALGDDVLDLAVGRRGVVGAEVVEPERGRFGGDDERRAVRPVDVAGAGDDTFFAAFDGQDPGVVVEREPDVLAAAAHDGAFDQRPDVGLAVGGFVVVVVEPGVVDEFVVDVQGDLVLLPVVVAPYGVFGVGVAVVLELGVAELFESDPDRAFGRQVEHPQGCRVVAGGQFADADGDAAVVGLPAFEDTIAAQSLSGLTAVYNSSLPRVAASTTTSM